MHKQGSPVIRFMIQGQIFYLYICTQHTPKVHSKLRYAMLQFDFLPVFTCEIFVMYRGQEGKEV
jgi:hypothetical protein